LEDRYDRGYSEFLGRNDLARFHSQAQGVSKDIATYNKCEQYGKAAGTLGKVKAKREAARPQPAAKFIGTGVLPS